MNPEPDATLVGRFRSDLERVLERTLGRNEMLALAVSGGPDSMGMLLLARAAFPDQVRAATVDHNLRPESADEAAMVERTCQQIGVAHTTFRIEPPPGSSGNLLGWARQERYLLLKRWTADMGPAALCTAHHAEDHAETFLMRAARASGLSGLAAVRSRIEDQVPLRERTERKLTEDGWSFIVHYGELLTLRPLLRWRRRELRAIVETAGVPFVDDPTNTDEHFDRARYRRWLEQADWVDPIQIARSAENLARVDADLLALSQWLSGERGVECDPFEAKFDVVGLPRGVCRYLARMGINHVLSIGGMSGGSSWGPATSIEPLLDALERGGSATQANVVATAKGTVWHFREAPPRRSG